MFKYLIFISVVLVLGCSSCEKNIHIQLHDAGEELVVDGSIENRKPPTVVLTRSLNFFSAIDTNLLKTLFVHGAIVSVTGNGYTVTLSEHEVDTLNGNKYYYYTTDSSDADLMRGKKGQTYTLQIKTNGKSYEAQTTIPKGGFKLDSLWWVWGMKNNKPDTTRAYLMARIIDPPILGNYARYFTKRNNEPFYPGLNSVADDEVTNGTIFDFQIDRGVNKSDKIDFNNYGYFLPGDTVTLKFCNIDKATFNFWHTWEYAWSNEANPFSTPTIVLGNVKGALGYWGGYAAQYKTVIISK